MNRELTRELETAMGFNPGRSILDIINDALDLKYPTRKNYTYSDCNEEWVPTNYDIHQALVTYNKVRHESNNRKVQNLAGPLSASQ